MVLCKCGCKEEVTVFRNKPRIYKSGHNSKGNNNPSYKGGFYHTKDYKYVKDSKHPNSNGGGYIPEHVFVFTDYYKCCMLKWGIVHHIDENKFNNNINNLEGMMRSKHLIIHGPLKYRKYRKIDTSSRYCILCGNKTYVSKKGRELWFTHNNQFICRKCHRKMLYIKSNP